MDDLRKLKRRIEDKTGWHQEYEDLTASFEMCPKYEAHELTEEEIEEIAQKAAERAVVLAKNDIYKGVGKAVVGWVFYVVGAAGIGLLVVSIKMGWIKS